MPRLTKAERAHLVTAGELSVVKAELLTLRADLHQALAQNKDLYTDREAWRHRAMSAYDALSEVRQQLLSERIEARGKTA